MMRRWVSALLCLGVFFALRIPSTHADYQIPEQTEPIFDLGDRRATTSTSVKDFAIYEGPDSVSWAQGKSFSLNYPSNRFVPADTIPANPPIHLVPRRPIDPANELSNTLYANQRLKRLLEEYAALQTHAREVLSGSEGPFTMIQTSSESKPPATIYQLQEDLKQKRITASRELSIAMTRAQASEDALHDVPETPSEIEEKEGNSSEGRFLEKDRLRKSNLSTNIMTGKSYDILNDSGSNLPWIIETGFKLLVYLQENKVEAVIYGGILMAVFMGISALRRH